MSGDLVRNQFSLADLRPIIGEKKYRIFFSLLALIAMTVVLLPGITDRVDCFMGDFWLRHLARWREPHKDIVIVGIGTESLEEIQERWPWSRQQLAKLLQTIGRGRPKFIILDILLQHQQIQREVDGDAILARTIKNLGNVFLVSILEEVLTPFGKKIRHFRNLPLFRQVALAEGFVWGFIDPDGVIRLSVLKAHQMGLSSCISQVFERVYKIVPQPYKAIRQFETTRIAYAVGKHGLPHIEAIDLMNEKISPDILAGKIVIVGVTALVLHDFHPTPLGVISGAEVLASSLDTLLCKRRTGTDLGIIFRLALMLLGIAMGLIFTGNGGLLAFWRSMSAMSLIAFLGTLVSVLWGPFLPWSVMILGWFGVALVALVGYMFLNVVSLQISRNEARAAGEIQSLLLPSDPWTFRDEYSCRGLCIPCEESGGDYYDYFPMPDGSLLFFTGDVSGHGIPAAMVAAMAKTACQLLQSLPVQNPLEIRNTLNTLLRNLVHKRKLMTMLIGHLNPVTHRVVLANAGHPPAAYVTLEGEVKVLESPCFPLGAAPFLPEKVIDLKMEPGSALVLFTDGVFEALNSKNEMYGYQNWYAYLGKKANKLDLHTPIEDLLLEMRTHAAEIEVDDDVTILLLQRSIAAKEQSR